MSLNLNAQAWALADELERSAPTFRVSVTHLADGGRLIDAGVSAPGGLAAGLHLARICLAGAGEVSLIPARPGLSSGWDVCVRTDHPVQACLAAQYAGWQIQVGKFFAMGSGPMRAVAGREQMITDLKLGESAGQAVGVLETDVLPGDDVFQYVSEKTGLPRERITLIAASVSSIAGGLQVVARSVETGLHKLHELKFDVRRVVSGAGLAPLPPAGSDSLTAMSRTNDAILYGGDVTLWVRASEEDLADIGPRIPSSASPDHGRTFGEIFARYDRDFYKIDPHLFSPAVIQLVHVDSGRTRQFGRLEPQLLAKSFAAPRQD